MLLRPRKHPHSADEPVSPADIAESLLAMGMMAWFVAPVPLLWAPPLWVLALMMPVERKAEAKPAAPVQAERVVAVLAPPVPQPSIATPLQASPPALPRQARPARVKPRSRPTSSRS